MYDPRNGGTRSCAAPRSATPSRPSPGLGFTDTFRLFDQPERSFSWWDYRAAAFRRNRGLRIDLILATEGLAGRCTSCRIDRDARAKERPSDHAPVVAEFDV